MSRYRKTSILMWGDEKFKNLTPLPPSGQSLWIVLITGPFTTNIPGLSVAGKMAMAERLKWSLKDFEKAFQECFSKGMVKVDWNAPLIWTPNSIHHNQPENPNVIKGWVKTWETIPECELKNEAYQVLSYFLEDFSKAFHKAFIEGCGKTYLKTSAKGIRKQEQEQEQKQEEKLYKKEKGEVALASENGGVDVENDENEVWDNDEDLDESAGNMENSGDHLKKRPDAQVGGAIVDPGAITAVFEKWNQEGVFVHKSLESVEGLESKIRLALVHHSKDEIFSAIENYAFVQKSDEHYFKHKWNLKHFLKRGLNTFVNEGDPVENFRIKKRTKQVPEHLKKFVRSFWSAYPNKRNFGDLEDVIVELNPNEDLQKTILAGVERSSRSVEFKKNGGEFIPLPANYIRAKGYQDEFPLIVENPKTGGKMLNPVYKGDADAEKRARDLIVFGPREGV